MVFGPLGGDRDDVVEANLSQRPEKRIAVRRDSNVAWLPWYSRTSNVARRASERGVIGSFDDHRRQPYTIDFDSSDQTVRGLFARRRGQVFQTIGLPVLVNPRVQQNESAVSDRQKGPGEQDMP